MFIVHRVRPLPRLCRAGYTADERSHIADERSQSIVSSAAVHRHVNNLKPWSRFCSRCQQLGFASSWHRLRTTKCAHPSCKLVMVCMHTPLLYFPRSYRGLSRIHLPGRDNPTNLGGLWWHMKVTVQSILAKGEGVCRTWIYEAHRGCRAGGIGHCCLHSVIAVPPLQAVGLK